MDTLPLSGAPVVINKHLKPGQVISAAGCLAAHDIKDVRAMVSRANREEELRRVEAAFLADICDNPEDDAPRLIFADWLEEHGDAVRAEFIRVQCALWQEWGRDPARENACRETCEPPDFGGCPQRRLRRRERELLARPQGRWTIDMLDRLPVIDRSPLLQLCARDATRGGAWPRDDAMFRFRRGLVASVTLPCADWLAHGPALVRVAPLEEVRLSDREPTPHVGAAGMRFGWRSSEGWHDGGGRYVLPQQIIDVLNEGRPKYALPHVWASHYPTKEAAETALSAACLSWAKATPLAAAATAG